MKHAEASNTDQSSAFIWLMGWFESQCDGEWEHGCGIAIETLDNPGWSLRIDLRGTQLDGNMLERQESSYQHETEWWTCWTESNQFHGVGGPRQLEAIIWAFREWAENEKATLR